MRAVLRRRDRAKSAGFTLVELLTVVVIMGILAALAVAGVRRHLNESKSREAASVIQAIRAAQEARRSELGIYLNCSTGASWYPAAPQAGVVHNWRASGHVDAARWQRLAVSQADGVHFGYVVNAGIPGEVMTTPETDSKPPWPTTVDPWFVIQAIGNLDGDSTYMRVLASSINGELYIENEGE